MKTLNTKELMKNPYINEIVFVAIISLIGHIILNIYTLVIFGVFIPILITLVMYALITGTTMILAVVLVFIKQKMKAYYINKANKYLNDNNITL
jgi:hypothetical protein